MRQKIRALAHCYGSYFYWFDQQDAARARRLARLK
jgi:hypothetical protein